VIRLRDIINKVLSYHPNPRIELIEKAYVFSAQVHKGQLRLSGEPYLIHPLAVAALLADLKLDKVHLARYSPRPHTVSARTMPDDVPAEEKKRRHAALEALQEQIVAEINRQFLGQTVEVLIEDQVKGKWRGRTPQNKLVFFSDDSRDWRGQLAQVQVTWTGPWSMQARLAGADRAPTSPGALARR